MSSLLAPKRYIGGYNALGTTINNGLDRPEAQLIRMTKVLSVLFSFHLAESEFVCVAENIKATDGMILNQKG